MNFALQNPWLLFCGLAAAVPLILYWLRRRTPQQVEWAAMQFLQDASKTPPSRRKLKKWLLLAVRVALPILIAIVAATPGCINEQTKFDQLTQATHRIFVFDVSASMGPRLGESNEKLPVSVAVSKAKERLQDAAQGDTFSVFTSAVDQPTVVTSPTADRATVLQSMDSIEATANFSGVFRPSETLAMVADLIDQTDDASFNSTQVILFSDFAAFDWQDNLQLSTTGNQRVQVQLIPCGSPATNLAIQEVRTEPITATVGQTIDCQVEVAAHGNGSETQTNVELIVNGTSLGQQTVLIGPDQSTTVVFPIETTQTGTLEIQAVIPADGLLIDDRRFQTADVRPEINVLCVEGSPGATRSFVAATTAIPDSGLPVISTVVIGLDRLIESNPQSTDVLAMFGCEKLDGGQIDFVTTLVADGTAVLICLGPQTDIASWQSLFAALARVTDKIGTNELRLTPNIVEGDFRLDPLDYKHPIVSDFRNQPQTGLIDVPIQKYRKVEFDSAAAQSILKFDNGDPALIGLNSQAGAVLICTTPLHADSSTQAWNRMPAWWSYVPLVNNATVWLHGFSTRRHPTRPGQAYQWDLESGFQSAVTVELPGEPERSIEVQHSPDGRPFVTVNSDRPGFVRVKAGGEESGFHSRAFNVNWREQNLDRADMATINSWFPSGKSGNAASTSNGFVSQSKPAPTRSRSVYFAVLALIAVLLLIEPILANRSQSNQKRNSPARSAQ